MATRAQAIQWAQDQKGKALDYDKQYGAQCVDFFRFYTEYLFGVGAYNIVGSVTGASQILDRAPADKFTKVINDPNNLNQLPEPGDILIYKSNLPGSGGFGHVGIIISVNSSGYTIAEQNWGGMYVKVQYRNWNGYESGWLKPKVFTTPPPTPPSVTIPKSEYDALKQSVMDKESTIGQLQRLLTEAQNKPPKEVIKEVEKIVEKEVAVVVEKEVVKEVTKPISINDALKVIIDFVKRIIKR